MKEISRSEYFSERFFSSIASADAFGNSTRKLVSKPSEVTSCRFNFTIGEMSLFNRREYAFTQLTLPDRQGNPVANPNYVPGYTPRYYTLNESSPVPIFISPPKSFWDPLTNTWGGREQPQFWTDIDMIIEQQDLPAGAVTAPLSPRGGWISERDMKVILAGVERARVDGEPVKIDSALYTNNSIFALTYARTKSQGRMTLNGGLVAADLGVLVTGTAGTSLGLELNYDERTSNLLKIYDPEEFILVRKVGWLQRTAE